MKRRFELVVFDWDGTIVDSTAMIARCIQRSAGDLGLPVPSTEQASHVIGLGLADALARAVPELPPASVEEFTARYRHHYLAGESDIVVFSGVRELLVELSEAGAKLAVATGKNRRGLDRAFGATGLGPFFSASRCADETHPKPHPAMLLELSAELGASAAATVMIGDTTHDLEMARAAGAAGVGISHGAHPHQQLERLAPTALVTSIPELRTWLHTNR